MGHRIESALLVGLALLALGDSWRIARSVVDTGEVIGPHQYLFGVGCALAIISILYACAASLRRVQRAWQDEAASDGGTAMLYAGSTALYAAFIPLLGYLAATFAFFLATFRFGGESNWRSVAAALIASAALEIVFVQMAGLSIPDGLGRWLAGVIS